VGSDGTQAPTVVAVANLKGGVGKTTTAVHLAAGLARLGRETLLVDLDAQGSATAHLLDPGAAGPGVVEVLRGDAALEQARRASGTERLSVLPWSGTPEDVDAFPGSPDALRRTLARRAGIVVVDTPPHMGASTVAALAAADWILVPVNCEYLPILGLKQFNEALGRIRMKLRIPARVLGYVLTQVDRRERITWEVEEILRKTFGSRVFRTMIRIDTRLKTCPSHRTTIYEFEPASGRARSDYTALVDEFLARLASDD
jgi:chromosome partitioning protein